MKRSTTGCPEAGRCVDDPTGAAHGCPGLAEDICGRCVYFEPFEVDDQQRLIGRCRLAQVSGFFPCGRVACDELRVRQRKAAAPRAERQPAEVAAAPAAAAPPSLDAWVDETASALRHLLDGAWGGVIREIHPRFVGGQAVVRRSESEDHCVPIEDFWRRLCHIKGAVEAVEDGVYEEEGLSDSDRESLLKGVRLLEGSLTTFNLLFAQRDEGFHGTGRR